VDLARTIHNLSDNRELTFTSYVPLPRSSGSQRSSEPLAPKVRLTFGGNARKGATSMFAVERYQVERTGARM